MLIFFFFFTINTLFYSVIEKCCDTLIYCAKHPQGKEIIEHFIMELKKEGITHIPRWEEPRPEQTLDKERNKTESEADSSSEETEKRDRTSSTPSTGSRELQLGASATNILSIDTVNLNDGKCLEFLLPLLLSTDTVIPPLKHESAVHTFFVPPAQCSLEKVSQNF